MDLEIQRLPECKELQVSSFFYFVEKAFGRNIEVALFYKWLVLPTEGYYFMFGIILQNETFLF